MRKVLELAGGAKIIPRESDKAPTPHCTMSAVFPEFDGLADKRGGADLRVRIHHPVANVEAHQVLPGIDRVELHQQGWLSAEELAPVAGLSELQVDYALVRPYRMQRLDWAAQRFLALPAPHASRTDFDAFCAAQAGWLDDYSLFMALSEAHDFRIWPSWPEALAQATLSKLPGGGRIGSGLAPSTSMRCAILIVSRRLARPIRAARRLGVGPVV